MAPKLAAPPLVLAGVLLAAGWYLLTPSVDPDAAPGQASFHSEISPKVGTHPASATAGAVLARTSFGTLSPFGAVVSAPAPSNLSAAGNNHPRKQFEQLLRNYRFGDISPDEKIRIKESLRELKQDPLGRSFIIETFFSSDEPQLAESLYGLIRDADLKDVALLEGLIQRDSTTSSPSSKTRIVDLIADLSAQQDAPYSALIDGYLAQVALNSNANLRNTAASQRIWYLAHHQPNNLATVEKYLVDTAPMVREEVYSLIESRMTNPALSRPGELTLALNTALRADHLGMSADEKARVTALLEALTGSGALR